MNLISTCLAIERHLNDQTIDDVETAEIDYLDEDVAHIFDLIRFACKMIKKKIPKRKNTERDIDASIKSVIFFMFR
ncbi:unnamed protein product [Rhizophagus irregularis]|nr:unnamed protein product [Rhizophagus irregularis]